MYLRFMISLIFVPLIPSILVFVLALFFAGHFSFQEINISSLFFKSTLYIYSTTWIAMIIIQSILFFLKKTHISYYMLTGFLISQALVIFPNITNITLTLSLQSLLIGFIGILTGIVFYFILGTKLPKPQHHFFLIKKKYIFYSLMIITMIYSLLGIIENKVTNEILLIIKPYPSILYHYKIYYNNIYKSNNIQNKTAKQPWYMTGFYFKLVSIHVYNKAFIFIIAYMISYYLLYFIWVAYLWLWLTKKIIKQ